MVLGVSRLGSLERKDSVLSRNKGVSLSEVYSMIWQGEKGENVDEKGCDHTPPILERGESGSQATDITNAPVSCRASIPSVPSLSLRAATTARSKAV